MTGFTRLLKASLLTLGMTAAAAQAQQHPVFFEYAPVVDVRPILVDQQVPVEREVCWQEPGYHRHGQRPDSATSTIAGAIIGGVIGNQFGGGNGKRALTVAGAALGASVGHNASQHGHPRPRPVYHERCELQTTYETRRQAQGYRVQYEFNGELFETRMRNHPGDAIRLEVAARPLD